TRQLLAFSRQQRLERRTLDLNTAIVDMAKMLRRLIGENIGVVTTLARTAGWVNADRAQLEQVILNLAVNARDAMPDGGQLTLAKDNVGRAGTRHDVPGLSAPGRRARAGSAAGAEHAAHGIGNDSRRRRRPGGARARERHAPGARLHGPDRGQR